MANRIKGITIEIDGNTSKLDKALDGTNKQLKDTQASLKKVEQGLKMDPGNVVLLEQKQRLLGEAVANSAEKVKILEQAAKQADDALARGNAYKEKYGDLDSELEKVTEQFKELTQQKKDMDTALAIGEISTEEYDRFSKKLEDVGANLKDLRTKKKEADKEFSGDRIDQGQYDAINRDLQIATKELENTEKAARSCAKGFDELSRKAGDVSDKAGKISDAFAPVSKAAGAIGAAALAAVPATEELRTDLSMLETNAKNAGIGVDSAYEAFERLYQITGETDSSVEAVSNILASGFNSAAISLASTQEESQAVAVEIQNLNAQVTELDSALKNGEISTAEYQQSMAELSGPLETASQRYQQLNLAANQFEQSAKLTPGIIEGLANAVIAFPDTIKVESLADSIQETLATSSATGQFAELLDRVGIGADNFSKNLAECTSAVQKQELVLGALSSGPLNGLYESWLENNQAMVDNKQATLELQESIARMAESIAPLLTLVTDLATAFFDWFNGLDDKGKVAIGVILSLVAAISPVPGAISGVGNAIEGMSKIGALFSSTAGNSVWLTFAKWAAIITAVVVAVTLLIAAINVLMGKGEEMNSTLGNVGNITGDITGGISGRPARAASYSMRAVSAEDLPHLATGGVLTRPTVFMGGEYAGAGQDPEIVSPYSKMVQATEEALRNSGTGGRAERMVLEVRAADGFARYLSFNLAKESTRQGVDLVTT